MIDRIKMFLNCNQELQEKIKIFIEYFVKYYGEDKITYDEAVKLNDIYIEGMKEKVVSRPDALNVIKYLYENKYRINAVKEELIKEFKTIDI